MSRIKRFFIAVLVAFAGSHSAFAYDFEVNGFYYNILSMQDLTCEITYEKIENSRHVSSYKGDLTIPSSVVHKGKTFSVIAIGESAFWGSSGLTSVEIPNTIASVGNSAFAVCADMKSFTGKFASEDHRCLIVDGVLNSFAPAGLTSYTIPNIVTAIGVSAFQAYKGLKSVVIPSSVKTIGVHAFWYCSNLSSVELPGSVGSISSSAFQHCFNLKTVVLADGLAEDKAKELYAWGNGIQFKQGETAPKFAPNAFPVISISDIEFVDNGNKRIDAFERCSLKMNVTNTGKGAAVGCVAKARIDGAAGLTAKEVQLPTIAPGNTEEVTIELEADGNLKDGNASISVSVDEPNGFGSDPTLLTVETKSFEAPKVLIADYSITSAQGSTLTKRVPFDLQILLQNAAKGTADDVDVTVTVPQNVFLMEGTPNAHFAALSGGETKSLVYSLIVNNNYASSTIPVQFTLREKHGKYAENRTISLALNQSMAQNKIEIKGEGNVPQGDISIAKIDGGTKQADVDYAIPENALNNKNTFAVIIGNENYQRVTKVEYANNDAKVFAEYCNKVLGIPNSNIRTYNNATYGTMLAALKDIKSIAEAYKGNLNVIFYYAGHGIPDGTGNAYLLPIDADGTQTEVCLATSRLYDEMVSLDARQAVIFMDACFSGAQRGEGMLMSARGVAIKPKSNTLGGKIVAISAAQGTETAYPYKEMGHGLFTYYILKKLQTTKGNVSLGELVEYITNEVSQRSIVVNRMPQTPKTMVSPSLGDKWKSWKLR